MRFFPRCLGHVRGSTRCLACGDIIGTNNGLGGSRTPLNSYSKKWACFSTSSVQAPIVIWVLIDLYEPDRPRGSLGCYVRALNRLACFFVWAGYDLKCSKNAGSAVTYCDKFIQLCCKSLPTCVIGPTRPLPSHTAARWGPWGCPWPWVCTPWLISQPR